MTESDRRTVAWSAGASSPPAPGEEEHMLDFTILTPAPHIITRQSALGNMKYFGQFRLTVSEPSVGINES